MKLKIKAIDSHRNGVDGKPFYVVTFNWRDEGGKMHHMIATLFDGKGQCAVLDIDMLANDNVQFGNGNSWRGDWFETDLRVAINNEVSHALRKA